MNLEDRVRPVYPNQVPQLVGMLGVARSLNEPDEPNNEYVRGQAEMIIDTIGWIQDDKEDVIAAILGAPLDITIVEPRTL